MGWGISECEGKEGLFKVEAASCRLIPIMGPAKTQLPLCLTQAARSKWVLDLEDLLNAQERATRWGDVPRHQV